MRTISCIFLLSLIWSTQLGGKSPNILVIYTDDQGFGDASCYNSEAKFQTPSLDRLAREGIRFTNGHSGDSVCTPSRYALLTGRYCWRTTRKTGVMQAEDECLIQDGRLTIASMLKNAGYQTAMVGKWHLGMDFPGTRETRDWTKPVLDMPLDKGFDYFYGIPASLNYGVLAWFEGRYAKVPPTMYTSKKPNTRHMDYRIMPPYDDAPPGNDYTNIPQALEVAPDFIDNECLTRFTEKAIEWIRDKRNPDKPFFLYLPYTSPHYPVCPLPQFWGQGNCGAYGEFVIETDYHVGQILGFLEKSGLDKNTLIVFTSDNGPEKSWRERIEEFGHDSSGVYKEGKRSEYEGGHRVPFIIRWPDGIRQPGRVTDDLVGQVDLMATFAEIAGATLPGDAAEDSQSFAGIIRDPAYRHERLPLINHAMNGRFTVTQQDWKLIMPHAGKGRELYNLTEDPGEKTNVIDEYPEIADRLEQAITSIVIRGRTTAGEARENDTGYWDDLTWIEKSAY